MLVALAIVAVMATIAFPAFGPLLRRRALDAAAAMLAGELARARQEAVARNRYVGIAFERTEESDRFAVYLDGGRRGIRSAEIASGADTLLRGPVDLAARHEGVRFGIPGPERIPSVPPSRGWLLPESDPIRFGSSDIVSFSPLGEASTGSLYLTDRRGGLRAVILYGRTGRLRVWRWDRKAHLWRQ